MIFGSQSRSNRVIFLLVGTIIFLTIFVGLFYNHSDSWSTPSKYVRRSMRRARPR